MAQLNTEEFFLTKDTTLKISIPGTPITQEDKLDGVTISGKPVTIEGLMAEKYEVFGLVVGAGTVILARKKGVSPTGRDIWDETTRFCNVDYKPKKPKYVLPKADDTAFESRILYLNEALKGTGIAAQEFRMSGPTICLLRQSIFCSSIDGFRCTAEELEKGVASGARVNELHLDSSLEDNPEVAARLVTLRAIPRLAEFAPTGELTVVFGAGPGDGS
jgi:hypothetical protein